MAFRHSARDASAARVTEAKLRISALSIAVAATLIPSCRTPERVSVEPERAIVAALDVEASLEFRVVGSDGAPLDEPALTSDVLTLPDAVRRAVETDPSLQAALARVRRAAAEADQARRLPNPVLGVVLRAGSGAPEFEASFAQEFVAALQRPTRARAADDRLRAAACDAVTTALDVVSEVQERYLAAQAAIALLPSLEERLELVERLVETARARLEAGEGTRADVVTLDAQRVELEVSLDRARLDETTERLRLARALGEPSSAATWRLEAWRTPDWGRRSEREWVDAALVARPELHAAQWRLRALGADAELARGLPWEDAEVGVEFEHADGERVGPALSSSLPLFDSGDARRAADEAELLEARHEWTRERRRVVEEVRTAYRSFAASATNLARIHDELIPLERERRQLAEDAYRAGATDVTALFLAEHDLRLAQTQAIEVEAQGALALVRLQRAVGGPAVASRVASATFESKDSQDLRP